MAIICWDSIIFQFWNFEMADILNDTKQNQTKKRFYYTISNDPMFKDIADV